MEYKVILETFEGPLDLLYHLIEKEQVDIYDIPIAKIADQYLEYLRKMQDLDLDITSEFIVMAATLLEIKSRMLLPSKKELEGTQLEIDEVDPMEELLNRLIEYKKYKEVAEELRLKEEIYKKVFFKPKEEIDIEASDVAFEIEGINLKDLIDAFNNIIIKNISRNSTIDIKEIDREEVNIEDSMRDILLVVKRKKKVRFEELFEESWTRIKLVIVFLSILELIKLKAIRIKQDCNFSEIIIILNKDNI